MGHIFFISLLICFFIFFIFIFFCVVVWLVRWVCMIVGIFVEACV